jgi:hemolysin D
MSDFASIFDLDLTAAIILALAAGGLAAFLLWMAIVRLMRARGGAVAATKPAAAPLPGEMTRGLAAKDREFLPAALELLETPPSPVRIAGIWLICGLFAATLTWAYFGKLDIHAIAQGRIQPSGRSKVIQPLEPGKVVAVHVENGARVKSGDVLLELDPTESGADRESQVRELESSRAESARRRVAIAIAMSDPSFTPKPIKFDASVGPAVRDRETLVLAAELSQTKSNRASLEAQYAEFVATRDKLTASIKARERVLALAKERVDMRTTLNDQGSLSRAMVIEVLSQYESQVTTQVGEQGQLVETEAHLNTTKRKMDEAVSQFIADQTQKLAETERKADRLAQELVKATAKNERTTLKSPIAGTVQQLSVTTVGQVVGSGQSLMTIVPADGPIEIEAMIQNQDIGFVKPGQEAVIKVEAFPFTRYGTINGRIMKVSRDAVDEREALGLADPAAAAKGGSGATPNQKMQNLVFPATVRLERSTMDIDGEEIPLSPGMSVSVEVLTGQRRAINYVLSPLREVASKSGRER